MQIVITPTGILKCLYGEELDLHALGRLSIQRGSHVEPTEDGQWTADLSLVDGPVLGPFSNRSTALDAERDMVGTELAGSRNGNHSPSPSERSIPCFGYSKRFVTG